MKIDKEHASELVKLLIPELTKLCENCPNFGALSLHVDIHAGQPGKISLGIDTTRKIETRTAS